MITPLGAMSLAIEEAKKGLGYVAPNPPVGCVILDSAGGFLAKGYHRKYGGDHAEVDALKQVKDQTKLSGATLYVTLEPCAHQGKTPSCARHLAQLPLSKIVYGLQDPNPLVQGKGAKILLEAGKKVEKFNGLEDQLVSLAEIFLWNHQRNLPFITIKVATSLDGQMALKNGESKWITGEVAREHVHYLRAQYDAVCVGKNTFLNDNPELSVRHRFYPDKKNKVIVVDAKGETFERLKGSRLVGIRGPGDVFILTADPNKAPRDLCTPIQVKKNSSGLVDIEAVLPTLYNLGIGSILVEGGAGLISYCIQNKIAQRFCQYIAPQILGAKNSLGYSSNVFTENLNQRLVLSHVEHLILGQDYFVTGRF